MVLAEIRGLNGLVEVSVVVGIAASILGAVYSTLRYGNERRSAQVTEEDFYSRVMKDLNETLFQEIERLREEVRDRDATIAALKAQAR